MLKQTLNKGISTPIAIGIILILVIMVGTLTWWQYGEMWWKESKLPDIEFPEKELDKTADWEIYRNEEYGYEIKYPSNWGKEENIIQREYGNFLTLIIESPGEEKSDSFREMIEVITTPPSSIDLDQFTKEFIKRTEDKSDDFELIKSEEFIFDGLPARKLLINHRFTNSDLDLRTLRNVIELELKENDHKGIIIYQIGYVARADKYSYFLETANKIMGSFKVIKQF